MLTCEGIFDRNNNEIFFFHLIFKIAYHKKTRNLHKKKMLHGNIFIKNIFF